jgi:site-specific recombinase XerD
MATAGVPMRRLQEFMGHRDIETTQRYADYAPNATRPPTSIRDSLATARWT